MPFVFLKYLGSYPHQKKAAMLNMVLLCACMVYGAELGTMSCGPFVGRGGGQLKVLCGNALTPFC